MLALSSSLICELISFSDSGLPFPPPMVIFITAERTASKYAAVCRSSSVVMLEQSDCACRRRSASFANNSLRFGAFASRTKFTPPVIACAFSSGVPV